MQPFFLLGVSECGAACGPTVSVSWGCTAPDACHIYLNQRKIQNNRFYSLGRGKERLRKTRSESLFSIHSLRLTTQKMIIATEFMLLENDLAQQAYHCTYMVLLASRLSILVTHWHEAANARHPSPQPKWDQNPGGLKEITNVGYYEYQYSIRGVDFFFPPFSSLCHIPNKSDWPRGCGWSPSRRGGGTCRMKIRQLVWRVEVKYQHALHYQHALPYQRGLLLCCSATPLPIVNPTSSLITSTFLLLSTASSSFNVYYDNLYIFFLNYADDDDYFYYLLLVARRTLVQVDKEVRMRALKRLVRLHVSVCALCTCRLPAKQLSTNLFIFTNLFLILYLYIFRYIRTTNRGLSKDMVLQHRVTIHTCIYLFVCLLSVYPIDVTIIISVLWFAIYSLLVPHFSLRFSVAVRPGGEAAREFILPARQVVVACIALVWRCDVRDTLRYLCFTHNNPPIRWARERTCPDTRISLTKVGWRGGVGWTGHLTVHLVVLNDRMLSFSLSLVLSLSLSLCGCNPTVWGGSYRCKASPPIRWYPNIKGALNPLFAFKNNFRRTPVLLTSPPYRMESVDVSDLEAYAFPVDEQLPAISLPETATLAVTDEDATNPEDCSSSKPYTHRRDAVVGESVPADPTYWFSPARFVEEKTPATLEMVRAEVLQHPWFAGYSPFIKKLLEEAFELRAFEAEEIVTEPEADLVFSYVLHGAVELVPFGAMEARNSAPRASAWLSHQLRDKRHKGDAFGQEGLLHFLRGPRMGFTAVTLLPSVVISLRRTVFKRIMMVNYLEPHDFLANTINYVRVFDTFTNAEKSRVAEAVKPVQFRKGDVLLATGAAPTGLCMIQSGCVEVTRRLSSGLQAQVKLLVPSECVGDAEIFSWEAKSLYDYTAVEDVTGLWLEESFLYSFHGKPLLQHLFGRINVAEIQRRKELVEEIQRLDDYTVVDLSDSDAGVDEHTGNGSTRMREGNDGESSDDALDSDEEERYLTPVNMKSPETTNFLIDHFYTRKAYSRCDGVQRGRTLTVFTSPRHIPYGAVLFSAEPATLPGESEAVVRARRLRRRRDRPTFDNNEQFLYVVYRGVIEVSDRDGARIGTVSRGGSVGEHRLLKRVSAACEVTATVVSREGCDVMRLPRKMYRLCLMASYLREYEKFMKLFSVLPYAAGFPEPYLLVLQQCMDRRVIGTASVLLAEGVTPHDVFIVCDGRVRICSPHTAEVHYVERGDPVGGLEILDGVASRAAFVTEGRAQVLRMPAEQFLGVFRLGVAFVDHLRETARYRQLYGSGWKAAKPKPHGKWKWKASTAETSECLTSYPVRATMEDIMPFPSSPSFLLFLYHSRCLLVRAHPPSRESGPMRLVCITMAADGGPLAAALKRLGYTPYTFRSAFHGANARTHPEAWAALLSGRRPVSDLGFLAQYDCLIGPPSSILFDRILRQCPPYTKVILVEEPNKRAWAEAYESFLAKRRQSRRRAWLSRRTRVAAAFYEMVEHMAATGAQRNGDGAEDARADALAHFENSVRLAVPKTRLLVLRPGDGWCSLCAFLEITPPVEPFPVVEGSLNPYGLSVLSAMEDRLERLVLLQFCFLLLLGFVAYSYCYPALRRVWGWLQSTVDEYKAGMAEPAA
eukprot:gene3604-2544_t